MIKKYLFCFLFLSLNCFGQSLIPNPPQLTATSYLLLDAKTLKIISENNAEQSTGMASITKIMTAYVVADQIQKGYLSGSSLVKISEKCWRMEGSRMFIKEGTEVPVSDLMLGIIVQSGNDASCALAEHIAGSEYDFAELMNDYARQMNLKETNFMNPTGLPDVNHYSTAEDIAKLSIKLIQDFPETYKIFSQKEFTYNEIRQLNRNSLLWQDDSIDGIKTGHTSTSGYCMVSSAKRGEMRLIAVTLNSSSEKSRLRDSRRLLDYGFRYYTTKKIISKYEPITSVDVWAGNEDSLELGPEEDIYVTLTKPEFNSLELIASKNLGVKAPIGKNDVLDSLDIIVDGKKLESVNLVAVKRIDSKGFISSAFEAIGFYIYSFFMQDEVN